MTLYTDGTTEATKEQAETYVAEKEAAEKAADLQATADEVQAYVDGNAKLSADPLPNAAAGDGIVASVDTVDASPSGNADPVMVVITFPADTGLPAFWASANNQFAKNKTATKLSTYSVRIRKDKALEFLAETALGL